ncbi:hypothetical protein [Bacillus phage vB_BanS-Thrax4]|nr:hypothetical protein [Bacillus phage vB_BanS-Thrax4]
MNKYNIVIVYNNGLSRSTSLNSSNKEGAIKHALETDMDVENIISITVVEYVREDI